MITDERKGFQVKIEDLGNGPAQEGGKEEGKILVFPSCLIMTGWGEIVTQEGEEEKKFVIERRTGKDRRTGKLDQKFQHSVSSGFFIDMRKGERRKKGTPDPVSFN